ncbi:MobF family relaxase [Corynebacterium ulcerans]|uniref:MobF family relaxase n=1 Tax=Corynebacterium ulcerans TaxID=65058 RepID=UPI003D6FC86B
MMSFRPVHAGNGYQYLLRSVATNDVYDESTENGKLSTYYNAKGTPPGRWIGTGVAGFNSEKALAGEKIEADQMAALYGLGYHPDAHELIANGASLESVKMGRKFPIFTGNVPVLAALKAAEENFINDNNRLPSDDERSQIAVEVGRSFYTQETGFTHAEPREIIGWISEKQATVKQAVSAYDLTFSPTKSVSVLWALSDKFDASLIEKCHHEAVAETLKWAEDNILRSRIGTGGIQQIKVRGAIASEFTHFDTRAGDPDLHSHVLLSNKVQSKDGKWLAIDGKALFMHAQTLSSRYDVLLQQRLREKLGLTFVACERGTEKEPVFEVAGVPQNLIDLFSKRRFLARPVYQKLLNEYVQNNGHQPDSSSVRKLWQAAILETRDAKKPAETLEELRKNWLEEARSAGYENDTFSFSNNLEINDLTQPPLFFDEEGKVIDQALLEVADLAISRVIARRSHFAKHHVTTAVAAALKGYALASVDEVERAMMLATNHLMESKAIRLNGGERLDLPEELKDSETKNGVDRHLGWELYTTQEVIDGEVLVLDAAREPVIEFSFDTEISKAFVEYEETNGFALNEGQKELAAHLLQCGTRVGVGVGPAGTGKTTSMQLVTNVWKSSGHQVVGLAPSAAAAQVLGKEIGVDALTIDKLTWIWRGRKPGVPGKDLTALPIDLHEGDLLLVDEAGMATTDNLAALTEIAEESGALIRLIGDPYQLDAVGSGGLFRTLCRYTDAAELTDVMRFSMGKDSDQAAASLQVRKGQTSALAFYSGRGWLAEGSRTAMLTNAVDAYLADEAVGKNSLVLATNNEDVATINEMVRQHRIERGEVDNTVEVELSRGETAGLGDVIIARKNQRFYRESDHGNVPAGHVINGQLFTVVAIESSGAIQALDKATGRLVDIPADYVATSTHLGYGSTVHRAQGATVETAHMVIDDLTDRTQLYVGLTRGKKENRVYAVTDARIDEEAEKAHEHHAGNQGWVTGEQVFTDALKRDRRQKSAVETTFEEYDASLSIERITALYRHGCDIATDAFLDAVMPAWSDAIGVKEADLQRTRVMLKKLTNSGVDVRKLMKKATSKLTGARDRDAVVEYRLKHFAVSEKPQIPVPPPFIPGQDNQLAKWLKAHHTKLLEPQEEKQAVSTDFARGRSLLDELGLAPVGTPPQAKEKRHSDDTAPSIHLDELYSDEATTLEN